MMSLYDGLKYELDRLPKDNIPADGIYNPENHRQIAMDRCLAEHDL